MELQREWSRLKSTPLEQRTYCYFCNGLSTRKPHPPIVVFIEVVSVHDAENINICDVTIFQRLPEKDLLANYRTYIKSRNSNQLAQAPDGPREKDRHNQYTARFKCLECCLKPSINYRSSILKEKEPKNRIIAYECKKTEEQVKEGAHKSIMFKVKKIFFGKLAKQSAFPFSLEAYTMDYNHWESWVVDAFTPQAIATRKSWKTQK